MAKPKKKKATPEQMHRNLQDSVQALPLAIAQMEKEGKLKRVPFSGRAEMKKRVDPVMAAYAKEIGAEQILAKINAIK